MVQWYIVTDSLHTFLDLCDYVQNHNLLSLRLYIVQLYIMYIYIVPLSSTSTVNEALPKTERPVAMLRRKKKQRLYSHPFADGTPST